MERWQKRAIVKVANVDFTNDKEKIKSAFSTICKPLLDFEGIKFNEESNILSIGDKTYTLSILSYSISISCLDRTGSTVEVSFFVNTEKECAYRSSTERGMIHFDSLISVDFDYENILNTIMNKIIL